VFNFKEGSMSEQEGVNKVAAQILELMSLPRRNILFRKKDEYHDVEKTGQVALLFILDKVGRSPMSELGKFLLVSKPNITFLVDRLVEDGLVKRVPDESDRRVIYVHLTDKGKQSVQSKKEQALAMIAEKLSTLDDLDLNDLSKSLDKVIAVLSKLRE
jgi:DNA-binding MarR family transcriptional regulator